MKNNLILSGLSVLLIASCASTTTPPPPSVNISIPELNTENTVSLGEQMIQQAKGFYGESLKLGGGEGQYSRIAQGTYCNTNKNTNFFVNFENSSAVTLKNAFGATLSTHAVVEYDRKNNKVCAADVMSASCYDSTEMSIQYSPNGFCLDKNSFQQIIEFNGKNGQVLNFTYREFSNDTARQAFTTNFVVDLSESDILAYKGLQIKIVKATNSQITYKVIKNFNTN